MSTRPPNCAPPMTPDRANLRALLAGMVANGELTRRDASTAYMSIGCTSLIRLRGPDLQARVRSWLASKISKGMLTDHRGLPIPPGYDVAASL